MRKAIAPDIEPEEQRESFRQDVLRAWADQQADGLHVTAEEADAWLSCLGSGGETVPPEAHR